MSLRTASALIMIVTCWSLAVAAEPSASRPASRPTDTLVPVPEAMTKDIPPLRSPADLRRLLGESKSSEGRPIHVVLVAGPKDHGPGEHDYPAWQKAWQLLLSRWPLQEPRLVRLRGTQGREPRIAVTALVDVPQLGRVRWAGLHLDATPDDGDR